MYKIILKNVIFSLELSRESQRSTKPLQLTEKWEHSGIIRLVLRSIKSVNTDFVNQIPYFSVKQLHNRSY